MRSRHRCLSSNEYLLLQRLARYQFATERQLAQAQGCAGSTAGRLLLTLLSSGLVAVEAQLRPAIWRLTPAGAALLNAPLPAGRRQASFSVMAHACHRNDVELQFQAELLGFAFVDRLSLLKQGFNPGHGEHAGRDGAGQTHFVLLDDYLMGSARMLRSWARRHTPNPKYWPDPAGRCWREVAHHYWLFCTSTLHLRTHEAWLQAHTLPVTARLLPALWR